VAFVIIELECGIGVGLMLYVFPADLIPLASFLIAFFSALSIWGILSGRVEECGCYGGAFTLSPLKSALINGGYLILLGIAWSFPVKNYQTPLWKVGLMVVAILITGPLVKRSIRAPLYDLSRIKPGKRWRWEWLEGKVPAWGDDERLIVFINHRCSICRKWIPKLNESLSRTDIPHVLGIESEGTPRGEIGDSRYEIEFQTVSLSDKTYRQLAVHPPTAILVREGEIKRKWIGTFPEEYT
jgi:hypothetical protein